MDEKKCKLDGFVEYEYEYSRRDIFGSAKPSACAIVASAMADQMPPEEPDSGESEPKDLAEPTE